MVDDLSGELATGNSGWIDRGEAKSHLHELLVELGRTYAPALIANARAIAHGDNQMQATIDGKQWEQPAFPYQAKCLQWIREEYSGLSADDQSAVSEILEGTGCEVLLG